MSKLALLFFSLVLLLVSGCRTKPEAEVYEWVAQELLQERSTLVIASAVDGRWFEENSAKSIASEGRLPVGEGSPWLKVEHMHLVQRLFEQNRDDGTIDWSPRNHHVRLLAGDLRAKPRGDHETASMCFLADAMPAIGVANQEGRSFRPYYSFSRVAFSDDGQHAILKVAYACAPVSGAFEGLLILRRQGGTWSAASSLMLWIS
jgi:hypothetical protein